MPEHFSLTPPRYANKKLVIEYDKKIRVLIVAVSLWTNKQINITNWPFSLSLLFKLKAQ